jgi:hypothetical protein
MIQRSSVTMLALLGLGILLGLVVSVLGSAGSMDTRDFATVLRDAKAGGVAKIETRSDQLTVTRNDGERYTAVNDSGLSLSEALFNAGARNAIAIEEVRPTGNHGAGLIFLLLPIPLLVVLISS